MAELTVNTKPKRELVWTNIFVLTIMHIAAMYIFYLRIFHGLKFHHWYHTTQCIAITLGITAGYHRLWTHKTYIAKRGLQILLMIMASSTYQNSCYDWAKDHRVHHLYSETDADPHNAKRGFFFSHVGWLFVRKHPDVKEKGKLVDMTDLKANPIVMFQHNYYYQIVVLFAFMIPTYTWHYITGESIFLSFLITVYRIVISLHFTWGVNSFSHLYGMKPFTKYIGPTENLFVVATTGGEGFHNYHHTFPQDYKASMINGDPRNLAALFIDLCEWFNLVSDLKLAPKKTVQIWSEKNGIATDYDKVHSFTTKVIGYVLVCTTFWLI